MKNIRNACSKIFDPYYWYTAALIACAQTAKQYRNSYLGAAWMLLQPMAIMCVFAVIMPMLLKTDASRYAVYILATMPLWTFISSALITTSFSLLEQADTLKRCRVTSSLFPVANVLKSAYGYLIAFYSMAFIAWIAGLPVGATVLLWPLYFLPVLVSVMAISIGLSYCAPYVRDIGEVITVGMTIGMWASAVVYPIESLPEAAQAIIRLNPLYMLLEPAILLVAHQEIPGVMVLAKLAGVAALSTATGYVLYRLGRRDYVYYL